MEKKGNNQKVVFLGIGLIVLVMAFTIARPYLFHKKAVQKEKVQEAPAAKDTAGEITSDAVWEKITKKENIKILDTRESALFQSGHIIDSKNYPLAGIADTLPALDKNTEYILVDELGDPSLTALAREVFPQHGIKNVFYLVGGMAAWRNQNKPLITDGDPFVFADQAKVTYITPDDLKKTLEQGAELTIIDMRKNTAYSEGHIKGSMNIYLGELEEKRKKIPVGKKIILVDNDGLWAFKGAVLLFDMGILDVAALNEGLDKWKEKGYEMVK